MMDKKAYTQVYKLIEFLPEEQKNKIPASLIQGIKNNMDQSYNFEIDDENIDDIELLDDAEKILSVIYTDYLASDEEKKIIKSKEISILKEKENKKRENFSNSYYNFPKVEKTDMYKIDVGNELEKDSEEGNEAKKIMKVPKEKWYKRFIKMIKNVIHK